MSSGTGLGSLLVICMASVRSLPPLCPVMSMTESVLPAWKSALVSFGARKKLLPEAKVAAPLVTNVVEVRTVSSVFACATIRCDVPNATNQAVIASQAQEGIVPAHAEEADNTGVGLRGHCRRDRCR
jgi:hypothetical protein